MLGIYVTGVLWCGRCSTCAKVRRIISIVVVIILPELLKFMIFSIMIILVIAARVVRLLPLRFEHMLVHTPHDSPSCCVRRRSMLCNRNRRLFPVIYPSCEAPKGVKS